MIVSSFSVGISLSSIIIERIASVKSKKSNCYAESSSPISYAPPVESLFGEARNRLRTHETPIVRVGVKKCLHKRVFLVATASTDILHLMVIEL